MNKTGLNSFYRQKRTSPVHLSRTFHFGSLLFFLNHQISPSFDQTVVFYSLLNLVYASPLYNCETLGLGRWI